MITDILFLGYMHAEGTHRDNEISFPLFLSLFFFFFLA
jgi:hypothetical protein